jgi:predicted phage tail protein
MLTTVILDGAMGRKFGRKWNLSVTTPADALKLIDVNVGGLFTWIKGNLDRHENYKVICEYEDGRVEQIGKEEYIMDGKIKKIRFTPLVAGSGNVGKIIAGVALVIVGAVISYFSSGVLAQVGGGIAMMGVSMIVGGVVGLLTPMPKMDTRDVAKGMKSDYFDGPENTVRQGSPVPLIYGGDVLVGSQPISVIYDVSDKLSGLAASAPTTYISGQTSDAIWEGILAEFNASHTAMYGIPMNRPWNSDAESVAQYNILAERYKAAVAAAAPEEEEGQY